MADCERALGRPERALALAQQPGRGRTSTPDRQGRDDDRRGRRPPRPRGDRRRAAHPRERAAALPVPRGLGRRGCATPTPTRCSPPAAPTRPSSGSTAPSASTARRSPTPPSGSRSWSAPTASRGPASAVPGRAGCRPQRRDRPARPQPADAAAPRDGCSAGSVAEVVRDDREGRRR